MWGGEKEEAVKGQKETFGGSRYIYYLDSGEGFVDIYKYIFARKYIYV